MIDKLDLRIPKDAVRCEALTKAFSWDPTKQERPAVQRALHYDCRADLRSFGIDALLHFRCKHGDHHSKLEILDAGKKCYSEMAEIISNVTSANPADVRIMRVDLAADVPDVPVPWFKSHLRFKYKRREREFGQNTYGLISRGEVETISSGSRPNVYRVYNKVNENKAQFRRMLRAVSSDAEVLEFEKEFGMKETDVLTRVERQCGAKGIPAETPTFGSLQGLLGVNPFSRLELIGCSSHQLPTPEQCTGMEYYTGLGLYREARRIGMQGLRKQLNSQTRGNAARTLAAYARFFPDGNNASITMDGIVKIFHESTRVQLAA